MFGVPKYTVNKRLLQLWLLWLEKRLAKRLLLVVENRKNK
jgi:hypothetical protein